MKKGQIISGREGHCGQGWIKLAGKSQYLIHEILFYIIETNLESYQTFKVALQSKSPYSVRIRKNTD